MPTVPAPQLEAFLTRVWSALGVPPDNARTVSAALVEADLCGHDSHGVIRLSQWVEHLLDGRLQPGAPFTIVREAPAALVVDGGWNFGAVVCGRATELAIAKAKQGGVGVAAVRRSHHLGRLGDYCARAAAAGCVSQVVVNNHGAAAAVAPWGGRERRLATNPIAFGIPRREAPPILVDVTTSVAPEGKVRVLRNRGAAAPEGWLIDAEGRPTRDPATFYADPPGALLPLGGEVGHKGYGLSVAVDLLAGALSGGGCTRPEPPPVYRNAATITVYDPAAFGDEETFAASVEQLVGDLRSCRPQPGVSAVLLPGEPEQRTREQRARDGLPIDPTTWAQVLAVAASVGVPPISTVA